MYVCLCSAVTDSDIRQAVAEGCCSVKALKNSLGVGAGCGKCVKTAKHIMEDMIAEMPPTKVIRAA